MQLSSRENQVLATIIERYIHEAKPVGSRIVARLSGLGLSPASIRNTMADLTDKGLLEQPHTSAGRMPTREAFRQYLSRTLPAHTLGDTQRESIRTGLGGPGQNTKDILRRSSTVLSDFSKQVGMVVAPVEDDVRWRSIDFVPVHTGLAMAVLVLDGGLVQNRMVAVAEHITRDDLTAFGNYLNHHYGGLTLTEARTQILRELSGTRERLDRLCRQALSIAHDTFEATTERDFFFDGASRILDTPKFSDVETMRRLMHLLDERSRLVELLDQTIEADGMNITFTQDKDAPKNENWSVVSSPYGKSGRARGVIGVIGPIRMNYAAVVPVVDFTARMLTELLRNRY